MDANKDVVEITSTDTTNVVNKDAFEELASKMGTLSISKPKVFTDLPPELRNQVYHCFLTRRPSWKFALRFALMCRTVRWEFWPLYLEKGFSSIQVRLDCFLALLDTFFPPGRPKDMREHAGQIVVTLDDMADCRDHNILALLSCLRNNPGPKVEFHDDFWRWEAGDLNHLVHTAKTSPAWEQFQAPDIEGIKIRSRRGWGDYDGTPHRCHHAWEVTVVLKSECVKGWGDDVEEHRRRIGKLLDRMHLRGFTGLKVQVGTPSRYGGPLPDLIGKNDWANYW